VSRTALATNYFGPATVPMVMKLSPVAALALAAALTTACDGEPGETVTITSPSEGDVVSLPFEITVEASVPLGTADTGLHHVHVWFGDDIDSYFVVEGNSAEVTGAPAGQQVMHASLRHADHTEAGAETAVSIVIGGGTSD
jgi:hypothetical protein